MKGTSAYDQLSRKQKIQESINVLAATEDKAILSAMGIVISDSESDSDTDTENISSDSCNESETLSSLQLEMP